MVLYRTRRDHRSDDDSNGAHVMRGLPGVFYRLVAALMWALVLVGPAHAITETRAADAVPPTLLTLWPVCKNTACSAGWGEYTDPQAAATASTCLKSGQTYACVRALQSGSQYIYCAPGFDDGNCGYFGPHANPSGQMCGSTRQSYGASCTGTQYSCPANEGWTLSGSVCSRESCTSLQRRYQGVCMDACPYAGTVGPSSGTTYNGSGTAGGNLCINGCSYKRRWTVQVGSSDWGAEAGTATGSACSTSTLGTDSDGNELGPGAIDEGEAAQASDAAAKCIGKGQGWGTVQGVIVCTGSGPDVTTEKVVTEKTTEQPKDENGDPTGPEETTETEKKTTCRGNMCTTEEVKKTDDGTGQPGGKTELGSSRVEDVSAFCEKNPADPRCKTNDQGQYCEEHPETAGCTELGTPEDGPDDVQVKPVGSSAITAVALATNMVCPSAIPLYGSAEFSWEPVCDVADMLRPLVLAIAWVSAGLLVVGSIKGG